ncbi:undecaprenyl diphosphate synthase [Paenibacillus shirakamiensis]|uniref:Isoprenyl transferase n=1 Tax=Paenibacillus shirakamiensis TaxID=1265935 RepID=A0ABS4JH85_9BACL|nr:isoprenyl transferase [Paenibacillus shirakamiensis]MBP2001084.1 undecaprenyl diphosphate synthase [Paenibacillus shirakamiensis]
MINIIQSWWNKNKAQKLPVPTLSKDNIPRHVAIIMDGNGRWANRRGLPRIVGHQTGMKAVKRAALAADEIGIEYLTMYAFSTENWKRPKDEVDFLMRLPEEFLAMELEELIEKNVRIQMMGHPEELPSHTIAAMEEAMRRTENNTGLVLNFALNYGSRREIKETFKEAAEALASGALTPADITEEWIGEHLYHTALPDPDLLIRTGGELRLSNFMLWQLAYSELWFTDLYWPEFGRDQLAQAVAEYQRRTRRYGGLS